MRLVDFAVQRISVEIKETENRQILGLWQRTKKTVEYIRDGYTTFSWNPSNVPKGFGKGLEELKSEEKLRQFWQQHCW